MAEFLLFTILSCLLSFQFTIVDWKLFGISLDQVWSILPALELLPRDYSRCGVNSQGRATQMQAKWIKLDLEFHLQGGEFGFSREDCDNRFHNNLKYHCDMIKDDPGKKQFCNVSNVM
mgnify:CR=1 FL=1